MPEKRESVEDKIARIVGQAIDAREKQREEEKNPALGTLRKLIREELGGVLGELGQGGGSRRRAPEAQQDDADGDEDNSILKALGLK